MQNKKLIRFVESFILFPIVTMPISFGTLPQAGAGIISTLQTVSSQKENNTDAVFALNNGEDESVQLKKARAQKARSIDAYFKERRMPLTGMGTKMVEEAEINNLDWRLLPAIAVRESTGGKFDCKKVENNPFGWGSCKIGFDSNEHAIEIVAKNLGGNNPKTAKHYDDKTTLQILRAYNPPSIVPHYAEQVIRIMNTIGKEELIIKTDMNA